MTHQLTRLRADSRHHDKHRLLKPAALLAAGLLESACASGKIGAGGDQSETLSGNARTTSRADAADSSPSGGSQTPYGHVVPEDVGVTIGPGVIAPMPTVTYTGPTTITEDKTTTSGSTAGGPFDAPVLLPPPSRTTFIRRHSKLGSLIQTTGQGVRPSSTRPVSSSAIGIKAEPSQRRNTSVVTTSPTRSQAVHHIHDLLTLTLDTPPFHPRLPRRPY